jgi:protocatechuate 3,4-dioxygenase beta subunit
MAGGTIGTVCVAVAALGGAALLGAARGQSERAHPEAPAADSTAIMCSAAEPGERLLIDGRVVNESGAPVEGAVVLAYNTDIDGLYTRGADDDRQPRIRATVQTDAQGRFQLLTVRPGPYPGGTDPAHVHFHVAAAGHNSEYSTIWFEGDPLITEQAMARIREHMGRNPRDVTEVVRLERDGRGVAAVRHTIVLDTN